MKIWVSALALSVIVAMVPSTSGAQAAAEGALTHALSSGMGANLGKAMGGATNQMAGRVAQQTPHSVPRQAAPGVKPGMASTGPAQIAASGQSAASAASPSGSMILSIQGGVRPQNACTDSGAKPAAPAANGGANGPAQTPPAAAQNSCAPAGDPSRYSHPSEITLPAPK
jgi:hypothetical protein